jgi:hypothetical protein
MRICGRPSDHPLHDETIEQPRYDQLSFSTGSMRRRAVADYDDFADCVGKNRDKRGAGAYCSYIKHRSRTEVIRAPQSEFRILGVPLRPFLSVVMRSARRMWEPARFMVGDRRYCSTHGREAGVEGRVDVIDLGALGVVPRPGRSRP